MVGKALSDTKKKQLAMEAKLALQAKAVDAYKLELAKKAAGLQARGAQAACNEFMQRYKQETGKEIKLNHATVINHAKGKNTRAQNNAQKAWLTPEEVEVIVMYIIELGNRGFPLSHRRLKEHVDEILGARLGDHFPIGGVGKKWTHRFLEKYSDHIKMAWSTPLEEKQGRAVNPHTNEAWFTMLGKVIKKYDIAEELTYGTNEIGCSGSTGQRERVMGAHDRQPHYQQIGGSRENVTVIVTICADGTSTPPAVIFKGRAYQVNWKQDNPANASIGYSKKGWTNGKIGVEWIKIFDEQTKTKAAGRYHLLLVDGHNSHYTHEFLRYACTHEIIVLCYPSHATHVYQGLDVVVFSVLKRILREERDKYERETGEKMSKDNFIMIYGRAHLRVLHPPIIRSAFRKTRVWPYDPSVVTADMMAPSKETSVEGALPLIPATPIRIIAKFLRQAVQMEVRDDLESASDSSSEVGVGGDDDDDDPFINAPQNADESVPCSEGDKEPEESQLALKGNLADAIKDVVRQLKDSSLDCLIGSYSTIPHHNM
ncbi:uncharacterized protein ARMOST_03173 [Armillaria ostoyae]|uniref:HTH CENPB-type domain-containing protein n=1 Tax=Armillaria ostoyae TaxID=47428 RepID=A0A284QTR1_ARMOS|nr:uncharacterized protein ARMOST_03173 [Armillaria ostoyae]